MHDQIPLMSIVPAGCMDHADVVLSGAGADEPRLRIDGASARAILAEQAGLPSEFASCVDLLVAALGAFGCRISRAEVWQEREARGCIYFEGDGAPAGIRGLPASLPLVIAARLGIPVRFVTHAEVRRAPEPALPPSVETFLSQLQLDGLGGAAAE